MVKTSKTILQDLELDEIIDWFEIKLPNSDDYLSFHRAAITDYLSSDLEILRQRQKAIGLLLENEPLCQALYSLLDLHAQVRQLSSKHGSDDRASISNYIDARRQVRSLLPQLHGLLNDTWGIQVFERLKAELEELFESGALDRIDQWDKTYVEQELVPRSMRVLLAVDELFLIREFQIRDFSQGTYENTLTGCVYSLTREKALEKLNVFSGKGDQIVNALFSGHLQDPYGDNTIFNDALDQNIAQFEQDTYLLLSSCFRFLEQAEEDIVFLLKCAEFCRKAQSLGTAACFPTLCETRDKVYAAREAYSFALADRMKKRGWNLSDTLVKNPVEFDRPNSALVVTGANQGGKTVYLQTIGMIQFLAQLGVMVPASQAQVSPVDAIVTIFAGQEEKLGQGQLSAEFDLLLQSLRQANGNSLILLNEIFTLCDPQDGVLFSRQALYALMAMGARSVWVTHLFELALPLEEGDPITSLVMAVTDQDHRPVYRIRRSPPDYRSYAAESIKSFQNQERPV